MPDNLTRLNVNMNEETSEALKVIAKWKGISYTEAIRRAISVYNFVLEAEDDGQKFFLVDEAGNTKREVVLR